MNKGKIMLGGALGGALVGIAAAMLIARRAERNKRQIAITPGEGLKLGILIFGFLRAIASLGND